MNEKVKLSHDGLIDFQLTFSNHVPEFGYELATVLRFYEWTPPSEAFETWLKLLQHAVCVLEEA